ncbi:Gfo/Idh/MocA family oxidoreductase [Tropicibacter sp. R15_0]|uniref:Gfo/Idh/MocA family protein n=1 Tax=Tropicibacter sp. R15_0 TaxID=2821101 RepID=UPI001ADC6798|nr:Gfo/Idh/MocA family oxidoreductase [Tropicibacter sp. R15_0]MBO9465408.1 Gfo/Idh/MocA family oxidoreductase [Tropicibacter sp. R15_0]
MKVALIGLGMVSRTFGDAIRNSDAVDLAYVYARSAESRARFLSDWPDLGAAAAGSVAEIAASDVDFVLLTTPPNARRDIVQELVSAGKPILMEKPVERTLAVATELVELCEAAEVPLGIMLQHRARPVVGDLRKLLPELGALRMAEINVPWWRGQAYYDEPGRGSYARDGGGVMISQAIHTLDLMLSLAGPVAEVSAMSATTGFHQMEAEDFVCAGLRFENGAVGQVFATTASFPGRGETITLHFAKGSVHLEAGLLQVSWQDGREETIGQAASSGAGADPMAFTSDWHRFVIEDFVEALQTGRAPLVPGREALEVHRLIDALEASAKAKRTIILE